MDQVVPDCLAPLPPFSNLSADLAGLSRIKYKERETWVLIYICNMLKALHLKPGENYMTRGTQKQVDRMLSSKMEDGSFSGTIPQMMKKVGLKLKTIMTSRSSDQESMDKLSDKVLGYLYNPVEDKLIISFTFNPAKKKKGAKVRLDLTLADVDGFIKTP